MKTAFVTILILFCGTLGFGQFNNSNTTESPETKKRSYVKQRNGAMQSSTKELEEEEQEELDEIVDELKVMDEDSYEYNLTAYINSNYSNEKKENLLKAYALNPNASEVQMEMFAMYTIEENRKKQIEFAKKIKGQYSENTLNYYRDLLPKSNTGFLVLSNKADAYPVYILQLLYEESSAVQIITMDFLKNTGYKTTVQQRTSIGMTPFLGNEKSFLSKLLTTSNKEVYVSATVNQTYLSRVAEGTYLTGLFYEWQVGDQKASLEKFWMQLKKKNIAELKLSSSEKRLYGNYLPPLLTLYKLRKQNDESVSTLRSAIKALAVKIDKSDAVKGILKEYDKS